MKEIHKGKREHCKSSSKFNKQPKFLNILTYSWEQVATVMMKKNKSPNQVFIS